MEVFLGIWWQYFLAFGGKAVMPGTLGGKAVMTNLPVPGVLHGKALMTTCARGIRWQSSDDYLC